MTSSEVKRDSTWKMNMVTVFSTLLNLCAQSFRQSTVFFTVPDNARFLRKRRHIESAHRGVFGEDYNWSKYGKDSWDLYIEYEYIPPNSKPVFKISDSRSYNLHFTQVTSSDAPALTNRRFPYWSKKSVDQFVFIFPQDDVYERHRYFHLQKQINVARRTLSSPYPDHPSESHLSEWWNRVELCLKMNL